MNMMENENRYSNNILNILIFWNIYLFFYLVIIGYNIFKGLFIIMVKKYL